MLHSKCGNHILNMDVFPFLQWRFRNATVIDVHCHSNSPNSRTDRNQEVSNRFQSSPVHICFSFIFKWFWWMGDWTWTSSKSQTDTQAIGVPSTFTGVNTSSCSETACPELHLHRRACLHLLLPRPSVGGDFVLMMDIESLHLLKLKKKKKKKSSVSAVEITSIEMFTLHKTSLQTNILIWGCQCKRSLIDMRRHQSQKWGQKMWKPETHSERRRISVI